MLNKEKEKKTLLLFMVMVAKREKNDSSITKISWIGTTTGQIGLTGWVLSKKKKLQPQKTYIVRKKAK